MKPLGPYFHLSNSVSRVYRKHRTWCDRIIGVLSFVMLAGTAVMVVHAGLEALSQ